MGKKYTLEFIKEEYNKKNYIFMDNYYKECTFKHNIKCHCGHEWKQSYNHFQRGQECPKCKNKLTPTLEFVKEEYNKKGYEFLDNFYNANYESHQIKCSCGHIWRQTYANFKQHNRGCPRCKGGVKYNLDYIKKEYSENGCEFLDEKYENDKYKHNVKFECSHIGQISYKKFRLGHRCSLCKKEKTKSTFLKHFGVDHPCKDKNIALKIAKSSRKAITKYHWQTGEELICIAGWEPKVVDYLNINKINYLWQPEVFKLSTGKTYRPDFYLVNEDKWIEIKGYMRPQSRPKWEEFHNIIKPNSELWDKVKLKEMKIL